VVPAALFGRFDDQLPGAAALDGAAGWRWGQLFSTFLSRLGPILSLS
jgi:hypothetical protein